MHLIKVLRLLVVFEFILTVTAVTLNFSFEEKLPVDLKTWIDVQAELPITNNEIITFFLLAAPLLLIYFSSMIGLLLLKPWGKYLYIFSMISLSVLSLFLGPTVEHAILTLFGDITSICTGGILVLILFTPVITKKSV
jgi:hypothetical protein